MSDSPQRIQLRRTNGWRMPPNAVKVDRTTKWGNPFIVGTHGTRERCVERFETLCAGYICVSDAKISPDELLAWRKRAAASIGELRGRDLACWCPLDKPCHADVLLRWANQEFERP